MSVCPLNGPEWTIHRRLNLDKVRISFSCFMNRKMWVWSKQFSQAAPERTARCCSDFFPLPPRRDPTSSLKIHRPSVNDKRGSGRWWSPWLESLGPQAGPGWTGLDRTGPGWTGLDRAGPGWTQVSHLLIGHNLLHLSILVLVRPRLVPKRTTPGRPGHVRVFGWTPECFVILQHHHHFLFLETATQRPPRSCV